MKLALILAIGVLASAIALFQHRVQVTPNLAYPVAAGATTSEASTWRIDPKRIVVGGSSAGATIALRLAYDDRSSARRVAAVFSWSGSLYSSVDLITASGPPLFIVHGTADTAVPVEDARALAHRAKSISLRHAIYICEGIEHHMPLDRRPLGRSIYEHLVAFLTSVTSPGATPSNGRTDPAAIPCPR